AVAVVVHPVARLARARVDRRILVGAVDVAIEQPAAADDGAARGVAVAVAVEQRVLVALPVTVVVGAVADLGGARVGLVVLVVAVGLVLRDDAGAVLEQLAAARGVEVAVEVEAVVAGAVAVVVDPVADLVGARVDQPVGVVAVAVAGGDQVAVLVHVLVGGAVAVVVHRVA